MHVCLYSFGLCVCLSFSTITNIKSINTKIVGLMDIAQRQSDYILVKFG
jgi:hypothetical protein